MPSKKLFTLRQIIRESEKSKDPTISSPILYADLKRQNLPTVPLLLTILYTSAETKRIEKITETTMPGDLSYHLQYTNLKCMVSPCALVGGTKRMHKITILEWSLLFSPLVCDDK